MKRINHIFAAVLLALCLTMSALAAETGSISLTLNAGAAGGSVTVYRVAEAQDGAWAYLPPFDAAAGAAPDETLARRFSAQTAQAAGRKQTVTAAGTVRFDALEQGLYLVVQTGDFRSGETFAPFFVSLPDGEDSLAVDATPKMSLKPSPTPPPTTPSEPRLPQTGQLWWPVPVLAFAGLICFAIGWLRRKGSDYAT